MPKLTYVWCWPNGGPTEEGWGHLPSDRGGDAFARTSRRVTERYSEALAGAGLTAGVAAIQLLVQEADAHATSVAVWTRARRGGDASARVDVPNAVAGLLAQDRAQVVLDVVDNVMRRIGEVNGWPDVVLTDAYDHVVRHDFGFQMAGPWKSNRSRTRRARPVAYVADDGWGRLSFEVADAKTGESLGFTKLAPMTVNSLPKFKRALRWTWQDTDTIVREESWLTRVGERTSQEEVYSAVTLGAAHTLTLPPRTGVRFEIEHRLPD